MNSFDGVGMLEKKKLPIKQNTRLPYLQQYPLNLQPIVEGRDIRVYISEIIIKLLQKWSMCASELTKADVT